MACNLLPFYYNNFCRATCKIPPKRPISQWVRTNTSAFSTETEVIGGNARKAKISLSHGTLQLCAETIFPPGKFSALFIRVLPVFILLSKVEKFMSLHWHFTTILELRQVTNFYIIFFDLFCLLTQHVSYIFLFFCKIYFLQLILNSKWKFNTDNFFLATHS